MTHYNDTTQRFKLILGQLSTNYRKELTSADTANLKMAIKQYGFDLFERAIHAHLFDPIGGRYYPTIANIAEQANKISGCRELSTTNKAELAWTEILEKMRSIGSYDNLDMVDKVALAAVQSIGGWRALCMVPIDKLDFKKREFFSAYDTYERAPIESLPSNLKGRIALENYKKQGGELQTLAQAGQKFINKSG